MIKKLLEMIIPRVMHLFDFYLVHLATGQTMRPFGSMCMTAACLRGSASPEPQWYCLPRAETTTAMNFCQASWTEAVKTEGPNLAPRHTLMHSARS